MSKVKTKDLPKFEFPSTVKLLDELNKELKKEYRKFLRKKRILEEVLGFGTLIIGARGKDGIVIGGDQKVIRGGEADYEEKIEIFNLGTDENQVHVAFAASGYLGVKEDYLKLFLEAMVDNLKEGTITSLLDIKFLAEDLILKFDERYSSRLDSLILHFMVAGLSHLYKGRAEIYTIGSGGYGEMVKYAEFIGHGSPYVRTIAKYILDRRLLSSMSLEDIANRMAACFYWISEEIDSYVGGEPTIYIMRDDNPVFIRVNYDEDRVRKFVENIKDKLREFNLE